jgi:glucose-6-phosphate isomerase
VSNIQSLIACAKNDKSLKIEDFINQEADRFDNFCHSIEGLVFDFSKSNLSKSSLDALVEFAKANNLEEKRANLFNGEPINFTENRAVLHFALRNPKRAWNANGVAQGDKIENQAQIASEFAQKIYDGTIVAKNGKKFETIIHIGIGGSDLGPRLVYEALKPFGHKGPKMRFCANIEPTEFENAIEGVDPSTTLVVCVSKTFTTIETLTNLNLARDWLRATIGDDDMAHLVAISAAPEKAIAQGFDKNRIFGFEEWVGGRYSLWSAVGLSLEMAFGRDFMHDLREGARIMDEHFETAPIEKNIPILGGLIGFWNRKILNYESRAIIPYAARLKLLPQFLQQLDMESNGKSVGLNGEAIEYSGPIVWGAEGTNAQHAFFQHLHQSPIITPLELILILDDGLNYKASLNLTLANALAQSEALLRGKTLDAVETQMREAGASEKAIKEIAPHRVFSGNRANIVTLMPKLDARNFGALLAFYEHRCFVEGALFGINSYDQWGVELGKVIALEIAKDLENGASNARDKATKNLIEIISNHK